MTLQQLKYAVTAADNGTISEAAQSLFIAQPSLTNAIKELENEFDITIFHRINKGIIITNEGSEFLGLRGRYCSRSCFWRKNTSAANAKADLFRVNAALFLCGERVRGYNPAVWQQELRLYASRDPDLQIIHDVSQFRSEVGILYLSGENEYIMSKIIEQSGLRFDELFTAKPHVFISSKHPLAKKRKITPQQLEEYPFLSFEQGSYNSFYFSEEIMRLVNRSMTIKVRDRATLFNLLVGLNGYTICTGIISTELNGENIISRPLDVDEYIRVGTVTRRGVNLTRLGEEYIKALHAHI